MWSIEKESEVSSSQTKAVIRRKREDRLLVIGKIKKKKQIMFLRADDLGFACSLSKLACELTHQTKDTRLYYTKSCCCLKEILLYFCFGKCNQNGI